MPIELKDIFTDTKINENKEINRIKKQEKDLKRKINIQQKIEDIIEDKQNLKLVKVQQESFKILENLELEGCYTVGKQVKILTEDNQLQRQLICLESAKTSLLKGALEDKQVRNSLNNNQNILIIEKMIKELKKVESINQQYQLQLNIVEEEKDEESWKEHNITAYINNQNRCYLNSMAQMIKFLQPDLDQVIADEPSTMDLKQLEQSALNKQFKQFILDEKEKKNKRIIDITEEYKDLFKEQKNQQDLEEELLLLLTNTGLAKSNNLLWHYITWTICTSCCAATKNDEGEQYYPILRINVSYEYREFEMYDQIKKHFASYEIISGVNCQKCQRQTDRMKLYQLKNVPKTCFIYIQRWTNKLQLNEQKCILSEQTQKYLQPKVFIERFGQQTNAGHYLAKVRKNNNYYSCNDSKIKTIEQKEFEESASSYLYLCSKQKNFNLYSKEEEEKVEIDLEKKKEEMLKIPKNIYLNGKEEKVAEQEIQWKDGDTFIIWARRVCQTFMKPLIANDLTKDEQSHITSNLDGLSELFSQLIMQEKAAIQNIPVNNMKQEYIDKEFEFSQTPKQYNKNEVFKGFEQQWKKYNKNKNDVHIQDETYKFKKWGLDDNYNYDTPYQYSREIRYDQESNQQQHHQEEDDRPQTEENEEKQNSQKDQVKDQK